VSSVVDPQVFGSVFVTLIVIMDPPGALPIFLALTGSLTQAQKVAAARRASLVALGVIAAFALFGQQILAYLHISLAALQGAGGLLLLLVALQLLMGTDQDQHADAGVNVALVPLGTPLLAGPGAIVATMLFVQRADGLNDYTVIGIGILLVMLTVWVVLRFSGVIVKLLRPAGIEVLTRIAGLLLAAIAVQLIADAIDSFVKLYAAAFA